MAEQPAQARRAATLFGAQDEMQACLMNVIPQPEREDFEQAMAAVRGALSAEDFAAAYAEGRAMTTAQAIQYALMEKATPSVGGNPQGGGNGKRKGWIRFSA